MKILHLIVLFLAGARFAHADCPSIASLLPAETIQSLQNLSLVQSPDAPEAEYRLGFSYLKRSRQLVVFLGEHHSKDKEASLAGLDLIQHFRFRGYEQLPWAEENIMLEQTPTPKDEETVPENIVITTRTHDSTIEEFFKQGAVLDCNDRKTVWPVSGRIIIIQNFKHCA